MPIATSVTCRSCGREIKMRRVPPLGERLVCPACGTKLEVIGLSPIEVDWAFEEPLGEVASDLLLEGAEAEGDSPGGPN